MKVCFQAIFYSFDVRYIIFQLCTQYD